MSNQVITNYTDKTQELVISPLANGKVGINTEHIINNKTYAYIPFIIYMHAGSEDVFIYAVKKELQIGETLELYGMHIFSNNECEFLYYDDEKTMKTIKGKVMVFKAEKEGIFKIGFRAKNINNTWVSAHIYIVVKSNLINYDLPLIESNII